MFCRYTQIHSPVLFKYEQGGYLAEITSIGFYLKLKTPDFSLFVIKIKSKSKQAEKLKSCKMTEE